MGKSWFMGIAAVVASVLSLQFNYHLLCSGDLSCVVFTAIKPQQKIAPVFQSDFCLFLFVINPDSAG